jgi:rRNA-processing protein FCF1
MKTFTLFVLFFNISFILSAQCFDYQSELMNIESYVNTAMRNLKKAEKADTLERAQEFIDKAISQSEMASASANLAKEYAAGCDCNEGINSATTIYNAAFDLTTQAKKAIKSGVLEELKGLVKKALTTARSVKDETTEGTSSCLE